MMQKANIGVIGLAVMGQNIVLNMESRGYTVAVFNRTLETVDKFVENRGGNKNIIGMHSIEELCSVLERPRKIMLMIKAGDPVDKTIEKILPFLDQGDIIIDGGNSYFKDTNRRTGYLAQKGVNFVGAGISGGEEGALKGPSIMPGGTPEAWPDIKEIFQAIAARNDEGEPCCKWIGKDGAGHFVKMVHNGIEYADMQMICESYSLLKNVLCLEAPEISDIFKEWNKGELNSYLVEITSDILTKKEEETNNYIVDIILDAAEQKGTGKWTSQIGLDLGVSVPTITEAVFARNISSIKEERSEASELLDGKEKEVDIKKNSFIDKLEDALYASKICSYAQGFQLMKAAAKEYDWNLNYGEIAVIWQAGCIIRAKFLKNIKEAFENNTNLKNLLLDPFFKDNIHKSLDSWRDVVATAIQAGVAIPAFSSAISYYDSYRAKNLPTNLLQAQRDYFGAHTYERIDKKRGEYFHTEWVNL